MWRDRPFVNWEHGVLIGAGSVEIVSRKGMLYPLGTSDLFQSATDIKGVDLTRYDDSTPVYDKRGRDTLWQLGTDHAGIATEMVVARLLEREGKTRDGLGRDAFVERVWQWKQV